jgi:hypothetical protein
MIIHRVVDGPYVDDDTCWLVCLVEEAGQIYHEDVEFSSFNEAYDFATEMGMSIYPIELDEWMEEHDR